MTGRDDQELAGLFRWTDNSHFSRVLVRVAFLEKMLGVLLEGHLPDLTGNLKQDLFNSKNAPLGSFSAKIDVCRAMGLITVEHRTVLHQARKIRNAFAHADQLIDFEHPLFQNHTTLKGNPLKESEKAFMRATRKVLIQLKPAVEDAMGMSIDR